MREPVLDEAAIEAAREAGHAAYHAHNEGCSCRTVGHLSQAISDAAVAAYLAALDSRRPPNGRPAGPVGHVWKASVGWLAWRHTYADRRWFLRLRSAERWAWLPTEGGDDAR